VRYWYVPGSIEAHDASMLPAGPVEAPEDACRILVAQRDAREHEMPKDAAVLAERLRREGARVRVTYACAERVATMELVESVAVWLIRDDLWASVTWENGGSPRAGVRRPYPHTLTLETLRVMLGHVVIEYGSCSRCTHDGIRLKADGSPRAHKHRLGGKCERWTVLACRYCGKALSEAHEVTEGRCAGRPAPCTEAPVAFDVAAGVWWRFEDGSWLAC
jgi:hypothetical protein